MTVVDYYYLTGNKPNTTVMVDADRQGFVDLLADRPKFCLITRRMTSRHPAPLISLRLERGCPGTDHDSHFGHSVSTSGV